MLRHGGRWWPLRTTSGIASWSAVVVAHRDCHTTVQRDGRERISPNISELGISSPPRIGGLSPAVRWMDARARVYSGWRTVLGARLGITASGSPQIMEGQLFPALTVDARPSMELWSQVDGEGWITSHYWQLDVPEIHALFIWVNINKHSMKRQDCLLRRNLIRLDFTSPETESILTA